MKEQVDPKVYSLTPRTVLIQKGPEEFALIIKRKSRIIMKDAKKQGIVLLDDISGHPAISVYKNKGFEIITF